MSENNHYLDFVGAEVFGHFSIIAGTWIEAHVFYRATKKPFERHKALLSDEAKLIAKVKRIYVGPIVFTKALSPSRGSEDLSALRAASEKSRIETAAARRGQVSTPAQTFESQLSTEELETAMLARLHAAVDQSDQFFQSEYNVSLLLAYLQKSCSDVELPTVADIEKAIRFLSAGNHLETSESGKRGYVQPTRWAGNVERESVPETQQDIEKKLRRMPLADLKRLVAKDRKPAKFVPPLPPLQL